MNNIWNELSEESRKEVITIYKKMESYSEWGKRMGLDEVFGRENLNPTPQIKTWEDLEKYNKVRADLYAPVFSELSACNILPAGLFNKLVATIKIAELINTSYGGMITDEEWNNPEIQKYCIYWSNNLKDFYYDFTYGNREFLAFHTSEQQNSFFKNNKSLCKDYYMIN